MERRLGLGLRGQILLALSATFLVSFSALGLVVVSLTRRAQSVERARRGEAMAESLVVALSASARPPSSEALARLVGRADVRGIAIASPLDVTRSFGDTAGAPDARTSLPNGDSLALWTLPIDESASSRVGELLRLYLIVTGSFVLLLVYVALTRLIVRPVEALTRAAERLSRGHFDTEAPVQGGAEMVSLAIAFNRMARDLDRDRALLEQRLIALEAATDELCAAQDQVIRSEKLASVGRLSAGVAHEIGNPLSAILGLVELMQLGDLSEPDQQEFLRRIRAETERIHRIIRDLLDFSRVRSKTSTSEDGAPIRPVVEGAVALLAPQKDLRELTITCHFAAERGVVRGSSHELTQLVLNLLLNAADATGGRGRVDVDVRDDDDAVVLEVRDNGPGIASEVIERLFEPFVTTKPAGKGTGLGLAVSHAIVERMGGHLTACNLEGGGACFRARLPAYAPMRAAPDSAGGPGSESDPAL